MGHKGHNIVCKFCTKETSAERPTKRFCDDYCRSMYAYRSKHNVPGTVVQVKLNKNGHRSVIDYGLAKCHNPACLATFKRKRGFALYCSKVCRNAAHYRKMKGEDTV